MPITLKVNFSRFSWIIKVNDIFIQGMLAKSRMLLKSDGEGLFEEEINCFFSVGLVYGTAESVLTIWANRMTGISIQVTPNVVINHRLSSESALTCCSST